MFKDNQAFSSFSVDDVEAARRFYGEKLGLEVAPNAMGNLDLVLAGGARIMVYPKPTHQAATFTVLNFMVPDIEAAVDGLEAAGVAMIHYGVPEMNQDAKGIAREASGGPQIAWFNDPAGNTLAVIKG